MSNTSPDFAFWRKRPTLKIWCVAVMMQGVDPYCMSDVTDKNGDALDLSEEMQLLISASLVGEITAYPTPGHLPDNETEVATASLDNCLRSRGYADLADALAAEHPKPQTTVTSHTVHIALNSESSAIKPVSRSKAQENAILATLQELGHDPLQLPKNAPGKSGVKAQVANKVDKKLFPPSSTIFEKAWGRMRSEGVLANKKK